MKVTGMLSKKIKTKKLRNVLESPFQIFWSEKRKEELLPVQDELLKLLPMARLEENKIIPHILKTRGDEAKVKVRQENMYRKFLSIGYQSVIRGLEKKELCCVIFSNNVTPILLLKVALTCAQAKSIPAIVVPDLKNITSSTLGFTTMALGFKTVVAESSKNPFHNIYKMVSGNPTLIESPLSSTHERKSLNVCENNRDRADRKPLQKSQKKIEISYLLREKNGKRAFIPTEIESKNPYNFISLGESIGIKSSSDDLKTKNVDGQMFNYDEDDSDSDEGNIFFVDNKPDELLLSTDQIDGSNPSLQNKILRLKKKKIKRDNKCKQDKNTNSAPFLNVSSSKKANYLEYLNKYNGKTQHFSCEESLSNTVKFKPLNIKSISSNNKKFKVKKKKVRS